MRFITPSIVVTALASLSLAGACSKSEKKNQAPQEPATAAAPGGVSGAEGARPAQPPMPRRLRSGEAAAEGAAPGEAGPALPDVSDETRAERRERNAAMREKFAEMRGKYDSDGDGELTPEESTAMRAEMMSMRVKAIDTDGDGKISRTEADGEQGRRRLLRDFDAADANKDSFVSPEELEASIAERRANRRDENGPRR